MSPDIFLELSLIIVTTVIITSIIRLLKQPLIIGYIISGILLGPQFLNLVKSESTIALFSQIGIALLLFIVGLTLNPKVIKEVGKVSLITGLGQIFFTTILGYFISKLLGFSTISSIYLGIVLSFSSTIIIMKLLSDKNSLEKTYGKISIGFLLVQDLVAILTLIIISTINKGSNLGIALLKTIIIGTLLVLVLRLINKYLIKHISKFFAQSQEFLFIFSIGWGLGIASLFQVAGLNMEIGALLAGVLLSISPYHYEISSRMKPLRDFFLILFFILLGSQIAIVNLTQTIIPAILLSIFILICNPLIVLTIITFQGYNKKIGFLAGLTVAQISEFSLIIIALGIKTGHLSKEILSLVTIIALITITGSSYMIIYSDQIYLKLNKYLKIFDRKKQTQTNIRNHNYQIILFGCDKVGERFINSIKRLKKRYLVVDYNPKRIEQLSKDNINCIYGDAEDSEFLDEIKTNKAKIIISTIPDLTTNLMLLKKTKKQSTILVTNYIEDAKTYYNNDATYVILPKLLGLNHAATIITKQGVNLQKLKRERKKHIKSIRTLLQEPRHAIKEN